MLKCAALLIIVSLLLAGCFNPIQGTVGSGNLVTEDYDLAGFTKVSAANAFRVTITQGDEFAVSVTADDNLMEDVRVDVRGSTLVLELTGVNFYNYTLSAEVTMPELTGVEASGATVVTMSGFGPTAQFDGKVSGASQLEGDVTTDDARFEASGASKITLTGSAGKMDARASGASSLNLEELAATDAKVEAAGASRATVNVSGTLSVKAGGASSVRYSGAPVIDDIDISGASTVKSD